MSFDQDYRIKGMSAEDFKHLTKTHRMPHKHRKTLLSVFFWLTGAHYWQSRGDHDNTESNMIIANAYLGLEGMHSLAGSDPSTMTDSLFALVEAYPRRAAKGGA